MTVPDSRPAVAPTKPWAFVAHKDGYMTGVVSADMSRKDLRKYLGKFAADGCGISTAHSREEYVTICDGLKPWRSRSTAHDGGEG